MYQKLQTWVVAGILTISSIGVMQQRPVRAESCPDLKIIFARGSGGERWANNDYLEFKNNIEEKLSTVNLNYEFVDLDYPAVGVGLDNLTVALGAFFGAGEAYEFGDSVKTGINNLVSMVNNGCTHTKYILGGYSQGAMVVSKALSELKSERIIYAATFGDPKIYLPEGAGLMPAACSGRNLSDYRMYVPDCFAYKGLLGAYIPYEPGGFVGKLGTWCNKKDIFCSSQFNITNHVNYVSDGLYEDASRTIFNKITDYYGLENHVTSPHDTAFLIDSSGSMSGLIEQYRTEALRLAAETLENGGRVALYDYRDLDDPYEPVAHCDFETCTLEIFQNELDNIVTNGGGDEAESLLSSSFKVMKSLNWKVGSTKSLVVLTDGGYLAPDRDGVTTKDVIALSKSIDPVNIYVITTYPASGQFLSITEPTGGKTIVNFNELSLLTDYIMERYDSLPRVEESNEAIEKPVLNYVENEQVSETEVRIKFRNTGDRTLVIFNEKILGITSETEITIGEIYGENTITLVPLKNDVRGESMTINVAGPEGYGLAEEIFIPKTPNTGKL
ncbi:cutinase family protein [Candidatus Saccharibacteria bacterium]|nr:cutinase family protein [Candidatus Saccharibacteria bacterium]